MMATSMAKMLEDAARERVELTNKHHEEVEQEKMALDRVQITYQNKFLNYEVQANATIALIKKLKDEKQATKDNTNLEVERIRKIVLG